MTNPETPPSRALGRKTIRASATPRSLMDEPEELAGVWQARVVTLFPDAFPGVLGHSLTGSALKDGKWQLFTHDLRAFGIGKHRNVDDTPAGGVPVWSCAPMWSDPLWPRRIATRAATGRCCTCPRGDVALINAWRAILRGATA